MLNLRLSTAWFVFIRSYIIDSFYRVPDIKKTGSGLIDKVVSDKRSLKNLQIAELGDDQDGMLVFLNFIIRCKRRSIWGTVVRTCAPSRGEDNIEQKTYLGQINLVSSSNTVYGEYQ